jgi:hypothetical protein
MFRRGYVQARLHRKRARAILQCGYRQCAGRRRNATATDRRALRVPSIRIARRTCRRFRFAALPARAAARLQPAVAVAAARASYRTSSNTPAGRLPCGRSAHNCRHARLRSWASIWFAPRRVMRSTEWQIQASSSVFSRAIRAVQALLNRIGQRMSIAVTWLQGERKPPNQPLLGPAKGPRIGPSAGMFLALGRGGGWAVQGRWRLWPRSIPSKESFKCNHRYPE